jgi:bifunctional DNA-binding transcriptional regulator/antitoxin component of YhaV-PrlF toxin-antitoxin module
MYDDLMTTTQAKVTSSGQVSLPAEIRRRWGVGSVLVVDRGDYAIVRPVPADTIAALKGVRGGPGPSVEQARADERHADDERERHRVR